MTADEYEKPPPEEKEQDANSRMEMSSTPASLPDMISLKARFDFQPTNGFPAGLVKKLVKTRVAEYSA